MLNSHSMRQMSTDECIAECRRRGESSVADQSVFLDRISSDREWLPDMVGTLHARAVPGFDGWFAAFVASEGDDERVDLVVFNEVHCYGRNCLLLSWIRKHCHPLAKLWEAE